MTERHINDLIAEGILKVETSESPEDAVHRRRKDFWMTLAAIVLAVGFTIGLGVFAGKFLWRGQGTAEERMWAASVMTSIATGAIGFAFGKNI
ncbi:hypothetical protein [Synechococcus sp. PCC 7336]|uniref:hypothetical protein n=1 Tax=Synechococcus sp. PCC 7336 TaxID=195250 RepID=UPI00034646F9|nr:hypothetical protein [Synechococcus sp. PCC 7336]